MIRSTFSAHKGNQVRHAIALPKFYNTDLNPGFTPTEPLNTILPQTAEQNHEIQWINEYQAQLFASFSTRMLEDMGALADPDATLTSLTNPMQCVFPRLTSIKILMK
jgi:hypothetical protein